MAVVYPSPIIVLDEPTNDVDPIRRQKIWRYLKKLSNKAYNHRGHTQYFRS